MLSYFIPYDNTMSVLIQYGSFDNREPIDKDDSIYLRAIQYDWVELPDGGRWCADPRLCEG